MIFCSLSTVCRNYVWQETWTHTDFYLFLLFKCKDLPVIVQASLSQILGCSIRQQSLRTDNKPRLQLLPRKNYKSTWRAQTSTKQVILWLTPKATLLPRLLDDQRSQSIRGQRTSPTLKTIHFEQIALLYQNYRNVTSLHKQWDFMLFIL